MTIDLKRPTARTHQRVGGLGRRSFLNALGISMLGIIAAACSTTTPAAGTKTDDPKAVVADRNMKGQANAPITIMEWSDFQ